jgi:hypothetical protein
MENKRKSQEKRKTSGERGRELLREEKEKDHSRSIYEKALRMNYIISKFYNYGS